MTEPALGGEQSYTQDQVLAFLGAQYAVVRTLAEAQTLAEAAPNLLEAIASTLSWELGVFWRFDQEERVLRCVSTWQDPTLELDDFEELTRRMTLRPGSGLPGRALSAGAPMWISNVLEDSEFLRTQVAVTAGLRAAVAFPLTTRHGPLGALEFFAREVRPLDHAVLEMMDSFGTQIGQYVDRKRAEEAMRASEALKTAILNSSLESVVTMDGAGRVLDFNRAAEVTFGYSRSQAIGEELAELIIPPPFREGHRNALERYRVTGEGRMLDRRLELTGMRAGGATFPVELTITCIAGSDPTMFAGFVRDVTERHWAERERERLFALEHAAREEAEAAQRRSQRLVAEALAAEDRELRRISEALHDEAVQDLLAARLELAAARKGDPESLDRIEEQLERTLAQLRGRIVDMHPVALSQGGLLAALNVVAEERARQGGFRCSVRVSPKATGAHDQLVLSLARELLTNAAKHSQARRVSVTVLDEGESVVVRVADDGRGIPSGRLDRAFSEGHIGLASSVERVKAIGGRFGVSDGQSGGTEVEVTLPASLEAHAPQGA